MKWRHQIKAYFDWYDSQIDGAAMRGWSGKGGRRRVQPARSRRQTYGLPTGIGDDIRARVERQAESLYQQRQTQRQAEPAPIILQAPDNRAQ